MLACKIKSTPSTCFSFRFVKVSASFHTHVFNSISLLSFNFQGYYIRDLIRGKLHLPDRQTMIEDFEADKKSEDKIEKTVKNMAIFQTGYMTKENFQKIIKLAFTEIIPKLHSWQNLLELRSRISPIYELLGMSQS